MSRNEALKEKKTPQAEKQLTESHFYNPALPNIQDILRKKQAILHSTERLRNIFQEVPVVAFCRFTPKPSWPTRSCKTHKHRQDIQAPCWHFPFQFQSRLSHLPVVEVLPYMDYICIYMYISMFSSFLFVFCFVVKIQVWYSINLDQLQKYMK